MNVVFLAPANSIHTIRWVNGLSSVGLNIHLISLHEPLPELSSAVNFYPLPNFSSFGYLLNFPKVRSLIHDLKPDLVNAHYSTGYGTLAQLVDYRPWLLSVWGSDVYDFPYKSFLHRWLVNRNLKSANAVASTSRCMADQTRKICKYLDYVAITPFGVDMDAFSTYSYDNTKDPTGSLTIGTLKTLNHIYGIDTLIRAFALLRQKLVEKSAINMKYFRLRIVGGGPKKDEFRCLARNLGVYDYVDFVGQVSHSDVPAELSKFDIYVALSRQESFGVAVIEAAAAGLPVVVSNADGLLEVVLNQKTGLVVPKDDPYAAAKALLSLVMSPKLRHKLGVAGREHVQNKYNWSKCLDAMIETYKKTIRDYKYK